MILALLIALAPVQADQFAFRSGFWNNLHHFLYVLGRDRNGAPDRTRDAVVNAPKDLDGFAERSEAERAAWNEAIDFYAGGLSKKDAVVDQDLFTVTKILASALDNVDLTTLRLDARLVAVLQKAGAGIRRPDL